METTLLQLKTGKKAKIIKLEGGMEFRRRLATLNIREEKIIKKITSQPLRGPITIEIDGRRVSLGYGMAMKIIVEEEK
ncbi:ferrous iron transport protein A [Candidatus Micrarchaeota archaeon]|nr:ferrous iron transport protein A [Candidatus Micrarchaeota archaeon]